MAFTKSVGGKEAETKACGFTARMSLRKKIERKKMSARDENRQLSQSFEEMVSRRVKFLTAYQSRRYARRYRKWVEKLKEVENDPDVAPGIARATPDSVEPR